MLALVKNIAQLDRASELLEDVVIVNNASTADYSATQNFIAEHKEIPFKYIHSEENLGVARGRNFAVQHSHGKYLIMLDDDAEMGNADCLTQLLNEFEQPASRETALISFRVEYFDTRVLQANAFPHKNLAAHKDLDRFETYYFAGGAHAIRRDLFIQMGGYPVDFFYGMEEYDLSYRLINAGYAIQYAANVLMLHKESPLGRNTKKEKQAMLWVNKSKVAWRYLPIQYFWSTAFMWSLEYLQKTKFDLSGFLKGWKAIWQIRSTEKRQEINAQALQYLRKVHARLWY